MVVENVLDATPRCLANTPQGGGGYGEGHVTRITLLSLAFRPLDEHSHLFDSCIAIALEDSVGKYTVRTAIIISPLVSHAVIQIRF